MADFEDIKIECVVVDELTGPTSEDSVLYAVPFSLSAKPPDEWQSLFNDLWRTYAYSSMKRHAEAVDGRIVVKNTTVEEIESIHLEPLIKAIRETNSQYRERLEAEEAKLEPIRELARTINQTIKHLNTKG